MFRGNPYKSTHVAFFCDKNTSGISRTVSGLLKLGHPPTDGPQAEVYFSHSPGCRERPPGRPLCEPLSTDPPCVAHVVPGHSLHVQAPGCRLWAGTKGGKRKVSRPTSAPSHWPGPLRGSGRPVRWNTRGLSACPCRTLCLIPAPASVPSELVHPRPKQLHMPAVERQRACGAGHTWAPLMTVFARPLG